MTLKRYKQTEEHKRKIGEALRGHVVSEETRKKMSEAHKGVKLSEEHKRKIGKARKGHIVSEETRNRISVSSKGNAPWNKGKKNVYSKERLKKTSGARSNLWQGGKSFEPYGLEFNNQLREQIRKRDNYRCQQCFRHQDELYSKSGRKYKLIVHHIDYNKKNNSPKNLISLCRNCHCQTNFSRNDWTKYFQDN